MEHREDKEADDAIKWIPCDVCIAENPAKEAFCVICHNMVSKMCLNNLCCTMQIQVPNQLIVSVDRKKRRHGSVKNNFK